MQNTLRLRSKIGMATRTYLDTIHGDHLLLLCMNVIDINFVGFVDIETPTLFKRTPEVEGTIVWSIA